MASNDQPMAQQAKVGLPMRQTDVAHLATIARLRGIASPDPDRARVLEVGSAAGRNLIPMAERHPGATFVGIDPLPTAVEAARQAAAGAGISNVEFRCQDLLTALAAEEQFDYIVVPGLYASLDAHGRDRLLLLICKSLSPQGVAIVAYHTYPAWHMQEMLGRMARYDARSASTPADRVAKARLLANFLQTSLTDDTSYAALLKAEVSQLSHQDDQMLEHGYMDGGVRPVYFRQFLVDAAKGGMQYLGDGAIGAGYTDFLDEGTELDLGLVAADLLRQEQYRDILRNRRYRQTLVCRTGVELATSLTPERLEGIYLAAPLRPDDADLPLRSATVQQFSAGEGVSLSTSVPLVKAALVELGEAWPGYFLFEELVEAACQRLTSTGASSIGDHERARLRQNLVDATVRGVVEVHGRAAGFVCQVSEWPAAGRFARWQAEQGEPPTNRRHETVWLERLDAQILTLLNGERSSAQLLEGLVEWAVSGRLEIVEEGTRIRSLEHIRPLLAATLADTLPRLARNALLVG